MEKRPYQRQASAWWESLETEADNLRVNPAIFRLAQQEPSLSFRPSSEPIEDCFIIKEAVQKLIQFLNSSHQAGCTDKTCRYDPKSCTVKVRVKSKNSMNPGMSVVKPIEFKLKKKRGRKSKYELQQIALLRASNGLNSY